MDLRSSKMIGMTWNLRSACRNRWSASLEWASATLDTPPNSLGDPVSVNVFGPIETTRSRRAGGGVPVFVTGVMPS